jgi:hypothetical protein
MRREYATLGARRFGRLRSRSGYAPDETIPGACYCFDEAGILGRVAQGEPQPVGCRIQPALEVYEGVAWPKPALQLLSRNYLTRPLQKSLENLKCPALQFDTYTVPAQFTGIHP